MFWPFCHHRKPRTGFFASPFDPMPLRNHIEAFQDAIASGACESIIAAVHTDPTVECPDKPAVHTPVEARVAALRALRSVSLVVTYTTEAELYALLEELRPTVRLRSLALDPFGRYTGDDLGIPVYYSDIIDQNERTELLQAIKQDKFWHE